MELRHIRYFVTVADAAGFSKAATRINISQPALSRQIRDLESELGVRLFDRIGRRVRLTPEGEDLLKRSRDLLGDAQALGERARTLKGGHIGVLRVGATPQTLESLLAGVLVRFRRTHPGIEIRLTEDGGPRLLSQLERGELDLAVTILGHHGLSSRLLFPGHVLAVMSVSHRLHRRTTLEVSELADESLLLLQPHFGSRQWFDAACQVAHLRPRVLLESAAPHTLITLARAGWGVAIVPSNVQFARKGLRVACVLQDGKSLGRWFAVNWNPRRFLLPHAESFMDELVACTRRSYPGKEFDRFAPPVPKPA